MAYKNNPEKRRAYAKEWRKKHPEYVESERAKCKQWAIDNHEHLLARVKQWAIDNPERYLIQNAVKHAKKQGLELSIKPEDVVIPAICPVFGIPLFKGTDGKRTINSPSLDRIDNSQGYVPENIWVISWKANGLKKNSSLEELEQLVSSLRSNSWLEEVKPNTSPEMKKQARQILKSARRRARLNGWGFDLELSDIVIPYVCPIFGLPLQKGDKKRHASSPSLDRIDSSKGYVKGNIWVISWRANELKFDATLEELETLLAALKRRLNIPIA